jgi:hypothetical protein
MLLELAETVLMELDNLVMQKEYLEWKKLPGEKALIFFRPR